MNREQRRKYAKRIKNDRTASICPECGNKARFFSTKKENEETALICECCGKIVRQGADITKSVPPGIYLPITLDMFDLMLTSVKENEEKKEENGDVLEGNKADNVEEPAEAVSGS